jgi:hypothetical protein
MIPDADRNLIGFLTFFPLFIHALAPALGDDILRCPLFASAVPNSGEKEIRAPSCNHSDGYIQNAGQKQNNLV